MKNILMIWIVLLFTKNATFAVEIENNDAHTIPKEQLKHLWNQNRVGGGEEGDDSSLSLQVFATTCKQKEDGKLKTLTCGRLRVDKDGCEAFPPSLKNEYVPYVFGLPGNSFDVRTFTVKVNIFSNFTPYYFHMLTLYPGEEVGKIDGEVLYKGTISDSVKENSFEFVFPETIRYLANKEENLPQWVSIYLWNIQSKMKKMFEVSGLTVEDENLASYISLEGDKIKIEYQGLIGLWKRKESQNLEVLINPQTGQIEIK